MAVQPSIAGILGVLIGLVAALAAGQAGILGETVTVTTSSVITQPVTTTLTETWTLKDTVTTTVEKPVTITTTATETATVTSILTTTTTLTQVDTVTQTLTTTERVIETLIQFIDRTLTETVTETVPRTFTTVVTQTVTDTITETVPAWLSYGVIYDFEGTDPWNARSYFVDIVFLAEGDRLRVVVEASANVYVAIVHIYDYPEFFYGEATPLAERLGSRVVLEYQAAFSGYHVIYYENINDFDITLYKNTIEVIPP